MPKPTKGPRLGGGPAHERLLLANLAAALFTHKSIKTTETKAKRLRPLAERLITFAKRGDLHARRRVLSVIGDKEVVHVLFTEIAPLVADREGGYTRITKVGNRKGDNAPMAVIELVLEPVSPKPKSAKKSAAAAPAAAPVASEEAPADEAWLRRRLRPTRPPPMPVPSRPRRARRPRLPPTTRSSKRRPDPLAPAVPETRAPEGRGSRAFGRAWSAPVRSLAHVLTRGPPCTCRRTATPGRGVRASTCREAATAGKERDERDSSLPSASARHPVFAEVALEALA